MILRRITQHVREQNWTAIALDFLIVVVGVFLGIQLGNWNEARADKQREGQYFESLASDISEEALVLDDVQYALRVRTSVIDMLFEEARGQSLPQEISTSLRVNGIAAEGNFSMPQRVDLDGTDRDLFLSFAIFARIFSEQSSTFETLRATGDLGLIEERTLAYEIASYYETIENLSYLETGTVRDTRDHAADIAKRHGLNPFGPNDYGRVTDAIRSDDEFAASLRALRNISATNYALAESADRRGNKILEQLHGAD